MVIKVGEAIDARTNSIDLSLGVIHYEFQCLSCGSNSSISNMWLRYLRNYLKPRFIVLKSTHSFYGTAPRLVLNMKFMPPSLPRRIHVIILTFLAVFICYIDRVNISVAIIPMADEYNWGLQTQGMV